MKGWGGGGEALVMKEILITKDYVSRCVAHTAIILFAVLLSDANKNVTEIRLHINFFPLSIERKSRPLTCKCIQHLAVAVHQVTPPATKLEPTVRSVQQFTVCSQRATICLPAYNSLINFT